MYRKVLVVVAALLALAVVGFSLPILSLFALSQSAAAAACLTDPATSGAEYSPALQGNTANAEYTWRTLIDAGMTPQATAGVMGNLQQESGINPRLIEGNGRGPGTGIAQWGNNGGAHGSNRWNEKLVPWAKKRNLDEWALSTQLSFMIFELKADYKSPRGRGSLFEYLRTESDIIAAVHAFQDIYEGCGTCMTANRETAAKGFYAKYKSSSGPAGTLRAGGDIPEAVINPAARTLPRPQPSLTTSGTGKTSPPLRGRLNVNAGMYYSSGGPHFALDLQASIGTPTYAVGDGVIVDMNDGVSNDGYHGSGAPSNWITLGIIYKGRKATVYYQHLSPGVSKFVSKGQHVKAGQVIGQTGNTGNSTGPHLHLATQWGWKTEAGRYDYLNGGPNGPDLIFPPNQVWGAGNYAPFDDSGAAVDLGDFGSEACEGTPVDSAAQTEVAPSDCPTTAPAGTMRDGSTRIGVRQLCEASVRQARTAEAARAIMFAFANLGKPYGGDIRNTTGFDCSSLIARGFVAGGESRFFSAIPSTVGYASVPAFLKRVAKPQPGDIHIMWRSGLSIASSGGQNGHAQLFLADGYIIQSGGGNGDSRVNVSKAPNWGGWESTQFAYMPSV